MGRNSRIALSAAITLIVAIAGTIGLGLRYFTMRGSNESVVRQGEKLMAQIEVQSGPLHDKALQSSAAENDLLDGIVPPLPDSSTANFRELLEMHMRHMRAYKTVIERDNEYSKKQIVGFDHQLSVLADTPWRRVAEPVPTAREVLALIKTVQGVRSPQADEIRRLGPVLIEEIERYHRNIDAIRRLDDGLRRFEHAMQRN
jgi:hypothetical protein